MGEQCGAQRPKEQFLLLVPLRDLPRNTKVLETEHDGGEEKEKWGKASILTHAHILIGEVPHVHTPFRIVLHAQEPPVSKSSDELVHKLVAVIAGGTCDEVRAADKSPDGRLHDEV